MRKVSLLKISNPRFYARSHARTKAVGTVATDKPSYAIRRTLSLWHESCCYGPLRLRAVGDSEVGRPTRAEESASWLMMVGEGWEVCRRLSMSLWKSVAELTLMEFGLCACQTQPGGARISGAFEGWYKRATASPSNMIPGVTGRVDTIVGANMECSCGPLIVVGGSDKDQQVSPMIRSVGKRLMFATPAADAKPRQGGLRLCSTSPGRY